MKTDSLFYQIDNLISLSGMVNVVLLIAFVLLWLYLLITIKVNRMNRREIERFRKLILTIEKSNRGIYKRIDENRELLSLLYRDATWFMINHRWVAGWIKAQDEYLNEIAEATPQLNKKELPVGFPMPFPQVNHEELLEEVTNNYELSALGYTAALHPKIKLDFIKSLKKFAMETKNKLLIVFCNNQIGIINEELLLLQKHSQPNSLTNNKIKVFKL
ncbi:Uncharacterised protein [Serratia ficaria]|uniref:hypothetical protein n=1 Tax=Serratia ficaria TaxID=61651 RepID=UPI002178112B|nr:hypothetical protein [Serratia ficaria]CAI1205885.1 Uncharacterised protein [Serratia ficaria]CAI2009239.1 Uncharacterised protein [Serratia ficaria]CAI2534836.1 Uncharacterised protein [Serratia ficaria]